MPNANVSAVWRRIDLAGIPPALAARSSHNLAIVGNRALILGGEQKPRQPIGEEVLDVPLDGSKARVLSGTNAKPWPQPRVGAASVPVQSSIYMYGGRGGKDMAPFTIPGEREGLWAFDPASQVWELASTNGSPPEGRSYHTMTAAEDTLYVHAGCPTKGRLGTLHSLDLKTRTWKALPDAPGNPRGGTVLAALRAPGNGHILARWGGFCGYELGGPLDLFDPTSETWTSRDVFIEGTQQEPPKRSVHAFVPFRTTGSKAPTIESKEVVAILAMGEGEGAPAHLGHDGAGKFLNDVYLLLRSEPGSQYSWLPVKADSEGDGPVPRGWFAFDVLAVDDSACSLVIHGGLEESNQRLADAWRLDVRVS